jgi:transposase InsO family protein
LELFNRGDMDWQTAAERLQVGRTRLYALRSQWLAGKKRLRLGPSGGNHKALWPEQVQKFLREFLPICKPLNYALISEQLARRFAFERSRGAVADYVQKHYGQFIAQSAPGPKPRRRWETAAVGELWQHDSSPHRWWPAASLQTLILTADDHSRKIVAGRFDADTTWSHFCLLRPAFEHHGCPASFYTDGLSLFGHSSASDRLDTVTQFQRALGALKVNHRVAPSPQAKGKIERLFGTFQKRLVTLLHYEKIRDFDQANQLLQREIDHYNQAHYHSTTGLTPNQAWEKAIQEKRCRLRPAPAGTLLNLHLALHIPRRVSSACSIEFLGRTWKIAATRCHSVLIVHHPGSRFWVIPPIKNPSKWPDVLGSYSL